jgi:hypothetical protein
MFPALLFAVTSFVADDTTQDPADSVPEIVYKKETEIEFNGANVSATGQGPSVQVIFEPEGLDFKNMIRLRADFNAEMEQSASEVR